MQASSDTPPAMTRRTQPERRAEAEQRLLEAARRLVARKGWVGMTLAEVGVEAGYSRGLAAHHFGSKAGLLRALATYVNSRFIDELKATPNRSRGLDALKNIVRIYLSDSEDDWVNTRALLALMAEAVTEDSETSEVLSEYNSQVIAQMARHIEVGMEAGVIRTNIVPLAGATLILGAMRGVMLQFLLKPSAIDLPAVQAQLDDFIQVAMARPPAV